MKVVLAIIFALVLPLVKTAFAAEEEFSKSIISAAVKANKEKYFRLKAGFNNRNDITFMQFILDSEKNYQERFALLKLGENENDFGAADLMYLIETQSPTNVENIDIGLYQELILKALKKSDRKEKMLNLLTKPSLLTGTTFLDSITSFFVAPNFKNEKRSVLARTLTNHLDVLKDMVNELSPRDKILLVNREVMIRDDFDGNQHVTKSYKLWQLLAENILAAQIFFNTKIITADQIKTSIDLFEKVFPATKMPQKLDLDNALHIASAEGKEEEVRAYLLFGANIEYNANFKSDKIQYFGTPLLAASSLGHAKTVKVLCDFGADIKAQNYYGIDSLMNATKYGHEEVVKILLQSGAPLTKINGNSAIHKASEQPSHIILGLLLDKFPEEINQPTNNHERPLDIAIFCDRIENVKLLLERKAETNYAVVKPNTFTMSWQPLGHSPLCIAAKKDETSFADLLLASGAHVNYLLADDSTALHCAAHSGKGAMVEYLLKKGADQELKTKSGKKAVDFAGEDIKSLFK